ncbi:MFS general substrate transporter [Rhizodiscina lignyota]|uniref:MFS general substrate transporter n=1 Tax=Rhizodiscina lignyota TaxID=1504668 RepID=A0A9P4ID37_9PEZI|nr:MFS general substrate transporter [Rhizodiscina lignyota]
MIGLATIILALVTSSFANQVWQLILTQGALYGIGGALHYFPAIIYVDEWFIQRKALAFGIMWAGTGSAGIVVPLMMELLLSKWGFRSALRTWAICVAVLSIPSMLYLRGRLPVQRPGTGMRRKQNYSYFKTSSFWCLQIGNIFQGLGYFIPGIYLPTYARAIGLSNLSGTVSLSLLNAAAVIGTIALGWFVDKFGATTGMLVSAGGASCAILLVWGLSLYVKSIAGLLHANTRQILSSFIHLCDSVWSLCRRVLSDLGGLRFSPSSESC